MTGTPMPDWVLIEAAKRAAWTDTSANELRGFYNSNSPPVFKGLCDMILKHEQPPVDRKVLCAREALAQQYSPKMADEIRAGDHDDALSAHIASIELYEQGFGV